ncbi:polyprenol reductase 2-like [Durio zibethinus]|uniref:Polyprenol reductase 2-like n=1 Tax=Durio zibethinus TaxID=66656 RepID=A0A6P5XEC4_DURZI|nr:polyprenol reductase 2-like [Durio zibethinus]
MELGLVTLLRAAWIAVTLPIIVASIPSSKLSSFHQLASRFANRGKTMQQSSYKFTVPQRFFSHFYVVAVVWTTLLLLTTWLYAYRMAPLSSESFHFSHLASLLTGGSHIFSFQKSHLRPLEHRYRVWRIVLLLLLLEAQVVRRLFETFYVSNYSPSARLHIFAYLTGLFYYIAAPLSLCCTCAPEVFKFTLNLVSEFIVKGKNKMPAIEIDWWESVNTLTKLGWRQWIGTAIFLWGWIHQFRCHAILGSMGAHAEQVDDYVIPSGDWFDIVSSPHYLAEIVIYAGLVVASGGGDLTIWLLFAFVVANLAFAAAETHNWYLRKFENYPRNRFAIIPFVY